jgi:4'-phosphopantetheinyl transferase
MAATDQTLLWLTDAAMLSDGALAAYGAWLGEAERERAERFVRPLRRRQFIVGRALLRLALARLLGVAPQSIVLRERPGNAPLLALPDRPAAGFSISHSGRWVACAASLQSAIGLDIECIAPARDVLALADHAFGAPAAAELRVLEGEARVEAFYRMWCLYEAGIKLGRPSAADYLYTHPGLSLALRCGQALAPPRTLEVVRLDRSASGAPALPPA